MDLGLDSQHTTIHEDQMVIDLRMKNKNKIEGRRNPEDTLEQPTRRRRNLSRLPRPRQLQHNTSRPPRRHQGTVRRPMKVGIIKFSKEIDKNNGFLAATFHARTRRLSTLGSIFGNARDAILINECLNKQCLVQP